MTRTRRFLTGLCMTFIVSVALTAIAVAQMPTTTTEAVKGEAKVTTQELSGTVLYVEGNTLAAKMSTGETRSFTVPETRKFIVDGMELTVHDLKVGTKLTATITTTTTPVTLRTTTVGSGKVWYAKGKTVIVTLPNGDNRQYTVKDDTTFIIDGKPESYTKLKRGMSISAEKIVEDPKSEIGTDTRIVGQAPPPPPPAAAAPAPAAEPPPPAALPKTASPLPLMALLGLLLVGGSYGIGILRRS